MKTNPFRFAGVSRPLSFLAAMLAAVVILNAFVVGCGGGGASDGGSTATTDGGQGSDGGGDTAEPAAGGPGGDQLAMGSKIYSEKCALCHGPKGLGDGPGAAALDPKPRNHTDGSYMNARTNEELLEVIKNGKGQMTPWGAILSDEEMHAALAYVRTLAVPAYTGPTP